MTTSFFFRLFYSALINPQSMPQSMSQDCAGPPARDGRGYLTSSTFAPQVHSQVHCFCSCGIHRKQHTCGLHASTRKRRPCQTEFVSQSLQILFCSTGRRLEYVGGKLAGLLSRMTLASSNVILKLHFSSSANIFSL